MGVTAMRRRAIFGLLVACTVPAFGACGGNGNAGAQVPDGGVCGNYPLCVATLMEACPVAGSCTVRDVGDEVVITFASGVVASTVTDPATQRRTTLVTRTDGVSTCYRVEMDALAAGASVVWRDPGGATVATGFVNEAERYVDVTCISGGNARVTDLGDCFGTAVACLSGT